MRLLLVLITAMLTACRTNPFTETPEKLEAQVRTFEDVVRWGELEKIYLFVRQAEGAPPVEVQPGLDNVRVTGYEVGAPLQELTPFHWGQTVVIDYVLTDRQVVRQLVDRQNWASDDEGKTWYRENPVPQFR